MAIHFEGKDLYEKVRHLAPIARSSHLMDGKRLRVRCIDRNTIEFTAVGRQLTVRTYTEFEGESFDDDAFVDADVLYKMSQKLKKSGVGLELKTSGELELNAGKIGMTFPKSAGLLLDSEKLPEGEIIRLSAALFAEVMKDALPYTSSDDSRPALCGVFIDGKEVCPTVTATDGHRLYTRKISAQESGSDGPVPDEGVLLPAEALKFALKLVETGDRAQGVTLHYGEEKIVIVQDRVFRIDVDRIVGSFPDFRAVLPSLSNMAVATFDSAALKDALELGAPVLSKAEAVRVVYNGCVRVQLDGDAGSFDADIGGKFDGGNARLCFNAGYLKQACDTLGGCHVRQYVGDALEPQVFVAKDDVAERVRIIVMPMRM